jgi:hypothetical protein
MRVAPVPPSALLTSAPPGDALVSGRED